MQASERDALRALHREADRLEAVILVQCCLRQRVAERVVREKHSKQFDKMRLLSQPPLFQIADLPEDLFDFEHLLEGQRHLESPEVCATFTQQAKKIFCAIDTQERGVVDEKYCIEIYLTYGSGCSVGQSLRHRARELVQQSVHVGQRPSPPVGAEPRALNFDQFCIFLMKMLKE